MDKWEVILILGIFLSASIGYVISEYSKYHPGQYYVEKK